MRNYIWTLVLQLSFLCGQGQPSTGHTNAVIRLYNPTGANMTTVVEIPTGSIASSGLIDWNKVHLELSGKPIPFAIREGTPHWKATLSSPVKNPLPQDLIVFSVEVPSKTWGKVSFVNGALKQSSHVSRGNGNIVVSYQDFVISINERTGMLNRILASGDAEVSAPMQSRFVEVAPGVIDQYGSMNPGNNDASISLKKGAYLPTTSVELVSSFSNSALTELNFVLKYKNNIAVAITYRVYPYGELEIICDERPWKDANPWLKYAVENSLILRGENKKLEAFQTYFPYYGFKDYASAVKNLGESYKMNRSTIFVFGEESLNGRFWKRKLRSIPADEVIDDNSIVELLSEGLVVLPQPVEQKLSPEVQLKFSVEDSAIAHTLASGLSTYGVNVIPASAVRSGTFKIELLSNARHDPSNKNDGYRIDRAPDGIRISSPSRFGLFKAVAALLKHAARNKMAAPLTASNPVIDFRAGGFGGGPFEVDFPYGDEDEWRKVIDGLMMSGMNAMTDLGMWSNWKMPVSFKYMPELRTTDQNAYDEVSGARFSSFDSSREFALKLITYIHERGGKVWLWVPVGAIPVTFEQQFPEATVTGKSKVPRFMHPAYRRYLQSYFKELLETYPLDGFVLIRDDNGGIDDSEEFKQYLAGTKTKDRVWEQYIVLHKLIRDLNFNGTIAVYPYFDLYKPSIEENIPADMMIVGHGTGFGTLTRNFETLGTMGDTWLDNLFAGFRIPSTANMKRLLSDRGSYWIGGAYKTMELTWESIGYFGWEPTASVNTFRYDFGVRTFGDTAALEFVSFSDASDDLWEIMNGPLFPPRWFLLSKKTQDSIVEKASELVRVYNQRLSALAEKTKVNDVVSWMDQARLYSTYFNYHLQRANLSSQIERLVKDRAKVKRSPLPDATRSEVISLNQKIYHLADEFEKQLRVTKSKMLEASYTAKLTRPFREFVYGYNGYNTTVDQLLELKQFDATMKCTVTDVSPKHSINVRVELTNVGFMPWMKEHEFQLSVRSKSEKIFFEDTGGFISQPVVYGDTLPVLLKGIATDGQGSADITLVLTTPFRDGRQAIAELSVRLRW